MDTFLFSVEPYMDDVNGRLSWSILGNRLLRVAELSAKSHKFGFDDMKTQRHAWVLSRLAVEMHRMPRTGTAYSVSTWVTRLYRQFTDRLFAIADAESNKPLGYARSVWALIDLDTRRPCDLSGAEGSDLIREAIVDRDVPIAGPSRLRADGGEVVATQRVAYSQVDVNGHLNSIEYLRATIDALYATPAFALSVKDNPATRVELAFSNETRLGELLRFEALQKAPLSFNVDLRKDDGTIAARAGVLFGGEA